MITFNELHGLGLEYKTCDNLATKRQLAERIALELPDFFKELRRKDPGPDRLPEDGSWQMHNDAACELRDMIKRDFGLELHTRLL